MFREIDDDEVVAWGWPWHGLIENGQLQNPQAPPGLNLSASVNTTLFDIGRSAPELPPELTEIGVELRGSAILNWPSTDTGCRSGRYGIIGAPITAEVGGVEQVVVWADLTISGFAGGGILVSGTFRRVAEGARLPWSVSRGYLAAEIGQGAGQPDFEVWAFGDINRIGNISSLRGRLLDVRGNRMLIGLTATGTTVGSVLIDYPERPPMLVGLIEIPVNVDDPANPYLDDAVIVESRSAALGARQRVRPQPSIPSVPWRWRAKTTTSTIDLDSCTGTASTSGSPGMEEVAAWQAGDVDAYDYAGTYRESMTGALLLARYGSDGIETARYDAFCEIKSTRWSRITAGAGDYYVSSYVAQEGSTCQSYVTESRNDRSVTIDTMHDSQAEFRHVIRGFDGAEVDRNEHFGRMVKHMVLKRFERAEPDAISVNEHTKTVTINGSTTTTTGGVGYSLPATQRIAGQALLSSRVLPDIESDGGVHSAIWPLSNNLACLVRLVQYPADIYLEAGPAIKPGGIDPTIYPSTLKYQFSDNDARSRFISGSWNPVTGEVARNSADKTYSWV
jgi:hypothetical protein